MTDNTIERLRPANTPSLRELFARTHDEMNDGYSRAVQIEMYLLCEVASPHNRRELDVEATEANAMELIEFLGEQGVTVPNILAKIRCFGNLTKGVAMRQHLREVRQSGSTPATMPLFQASQFAAV